MIITVRIEHRNSTVGENKVKWNQSIYTKLYKVIFKFVNLDKGGEKNVNTTIKNIKNEIRRKR